MDSLVRFNPELIMRSRGNPARREEFDLSAGATLDVASCLFKVLSWKIVLSKQCNSWGLRCRVVGRYPITPPHGKGALKCVRDKNKVLRRAKSVLTSLECSVLSQGMKRL